MEAVEAQGKTEENGIYIVIENNVKTPKDKYKKKTIKIISGLHVISGLLAISVGVLLLILKSGYQSYEEPFNTVGEGLFCGMMFLITGGIGVSSTKNTTSCKISAFLVLSILSALSGFIMTILCAATMGYAVYKDYTPGIVCHYLLIIIGLFELVLGILSSSFSCHACCGCCGGSDAGPAAGGNSVVYVPSQVEGDTAKPRVVHLNMVQLQQTAKLATKEPLQEGDNKGQKDCKAYSRFS